MSEPQVRPECEPFSLAAGPVGVLMAHGLTESMANGPASFQCRRSSEVARPTAGRFGLFVITV